RVVETLHAALNVLATVEPEWVRASIPVEWVDRYGRRAEENRLPTGEKEREQFAEVIGRDGYALLDAIWSEDTPAWMRALPAVETLRQVWVQSFMPVEDSVRWRQTDNVPPSALRISSPYDIEARYAHKRSTSWVGYKVHLTETCDEETPHIITNVHTAEAIINDNDALPTIHQKLSDAELLPNKHLVDAGYVEAQQLVESRREYGMELIGPVQGNGRWQHEQGTGFDISHFVIDWERQEVTCPTGKQSSTLKPMVDGRGNDVLHAIFRKADCSQCASLTQCTKAKGKQRTINIKPRELHEALQQARQREKTAEFKEEYRKRAGVEGTISQGVRAFGMRRSRYIGRAKTHLQH
ncbi:MAG: transposase, partial [Acidobacteria bacterium]|nr:transposase [Acidobacteriota bacterium]